MRLFRTGLGSTGGVTPPPVILPQTIKVEPDGYVYIKAGGQSNAVGWNVGGDTTQNPNVEILNATGNWVVAQIGQSPFNITNPDGSNNMMFHFGKWLAETYSVKVRIHPVWQGATAITEWTPQTSELAQKFIGEHRRFNMPPASIYLWHQGSEDVVNGDSNLYIGRFDSMIDWMCSLDLLYPFAKIILGEIPQGSVGVTLNPYLNQIGDRGYVYGVASSVGLDDTGSATGLGHFTGENLVIMGERMFVQWQGLMNLIESDKNNDLVEDSTPPNAPNLISVV